MVPSFNVVIASIFESLHKSGRPCPTFIETVVVGVGLGVVGCGRVVGLSVGLGLLVGLFVVVVTFRLSRFPYKDCIPSMSSGCSRSLGE